MRDTPTRLMGLEILLALDTGWNLADSFIMSSPANLNLDLDVAHVLLSSPKYFSAILQDRKEDDEDKIITGSLLELNSKVTVD